MQTNKSFVYKEWSPYIPTPGKHVVVEDRPFDPESAPPPSGITVKNLFLSLDPYQRGQMRGPDDKGSYSIPWVLNEPAVVTSLAAVLKSDNDRFQPGDLIFGMAPACEFAAIPAELCAVSRVLPKIPGVEIAGETAVGALGISGLSAYESFYEFVKEPREGKTIFITAASGGVGQVVGQIAKMHGMRVLGSTGSEEKIEFLTKEMGYDAAWNYKTENVSDMLDRHAAEGLDVYYDNVGGEQLEVALTKMKDFGTIISSGMIQDYNLPDDKKYGVKTMIHIIFKRLSIHGFVCSDPQMMGKYLDQFGADMVKWIAGGKIKTKEHVMEGIDKAPEAMEMMFKGDKFGKMVIKV